ncbi:hypothetical protein DCAR_0832286 [Daucus carota subsp. sativus]|uniref:Uncharacterized protein n=1 Tax=Daucus carota subsp. sativus TaxID=79200 RepID=A0A175YQB3_DAUCS|nr:hypothetical protein DCAR_0832286 [Daucus carota subsp. sativus]
MLADPRHPAESTGARNESALKVPLDHGKSASYKIARQGCDLPKGRRCICGQDY